MVISRPTNLKQACCRRKFHKMPVYFFKILPFCKRLYTYLKFLIIHFFPVSTTVFIITPIMINNGNSHTSNGKAILSHSSTFIPANIARAIPTRNWNPRPAYLINILFASFFFSDMIVFYELPSSFPGGFLNNRCLVWIVNIQGGRIQRKHISF